MVVSARSCEAAFGRQHRDERGEVAAEQRLATGQAQAVDAEVEEDVDKGARFLEAQDVLTGQPHVLLFGHAVLAPQIAAVGHRQPKVPQGTVQTVEHGNLQFTIYKLQGAT